VLMAVGQRRPIKQNSLFLKMQLKTAKHFICSVEFSLALPIRE